MRRISLALALVGAAAAAGCSGGNAPGSSGTSAGTPGATFTVKVRGETYNYTDPVTNTSVAVPVGGTITSTPAGINCGEANRVCSFDFPWGTSVVLTASTSPSAYHFYAGDCSGNAGCTVSGNADRLVMVRFAASPDLLGSHLNFSDGAIHAAEYAKYMAGTAGAYTCTSCHGATLQGAGIAPSCAQCHAAPNPLGVSGTTERCNSCHTSAALTGVHAPTGIVTYAATDPVVNGTVATFDVTVRVDGVLSNAFTTLSGGYLYFEDPSLASTVTTGTNGTALGTTGAWAGQVLPVLFKGSRFSTGTSSTSVATTVGAPTNGVYPVTIRKIANTPIPANATFMVTLRNEATIGQNTLFATAVTHRGGTPVRDLVGNQACVNCHATQVFRHREANGEFHHGANPYGVSACVVCHTRATSVSRGAGGDRLLAYVHGVHNSHNMAARDVTSTVNVGTSAAPVYVTTTVHKEEGVYARNDGISITNGVASLSSTFSIGFPSYINNCSVCHDSPARRTAISARPVSYSLCMSCHDSWDGFHGALPASPDHTFFNQNTDCSGCHSDPIAFHNGLLTERAGLIWNGQDQSIVQGARIDLAITGVVVPDPAFANSLVVTWTATLDGTPVDPCNNVTSGGNPVFYGISGSNMTFLRSYALGNDWVGGPGATSPGQPGSTITPSSSNTTCSGNVASTKFTKDTNLGTNVTRGIIALQGKPQLYYAPADKVIAVRSETPTYAFNVSDLTSVAARRPIVSNAKCLSCHPGSLYQHGGNRIDNVDLCVMCHNPASNEKNNRVSYGVTAAEAYDGKVGETIDMRTMIHAIHSAGESEKNLVYYRSNGIYAFGSEASIAAIPNWKTTPSISCFGADSHGGISAQTAYMVYGSENFTASNQTVNVPTASGAGSAVTFDPAGACSSLSIARLPAGYTKGVYRAFNGIVVHYPRALNDCGACHVNGSENGLPNQTQAAAVTVDPGTLYGPFPLSNQNDDVLIGSTAQSCFTCHQSGDATVQAQLRAHGYSFGWTPATFPNGKQSVIDAATP